MSERSVFIETHTAYCIRHQQSSPCVGCMGSMAPWRLDWWERFLDKTVVLPRDPDLEVGCLWWVGAQSRGGDRPLSNPYGSFRVDRDTVVRAHVAAAFAYGLVPTLRSPPGLHIDHECRRSLCVERSHLRLLPGKDNCALSFQGSRLLTELQEDVIRYRNTRARGV